jgi:glycosyltransferase involved in cell wall biosynthesis
MLRLKNPSWINVSLLKKTKLSEWDDQYLEGISERIKKFQSNNPIVSIVIIAYNEEINIIRCLDSLSRLASNYPFEIIVVDNNSSDKTAEIIKRLGARYILQKIQGCGIARQIGMETAKGKYILTGDADTLYPPEWMNELMTKLQKPGVVCVYGRYSFIADDIFPRWKLTIYETLSDLLVFGKAYKRPFLNALGMTMGFIKEYGLKVGYVEANVRGEDGRLAFDLMKFGSVKGVMNYRSRVWTGTRTISMDGKLRNAVKKRMVLAFANMSTMFSKEIDHNTRTSHLDRK